MLACGSEIRLEGAGHDLAQGQAAGGRMGAQFAHHTGRNFERIAQSVLKLTADHKEGAQSFLEKRKPEFTGR